MLQYVTIIALFLCGINSQDTHEGDCPNIPVQGHFNLSEFAGVWYEAERSYIVFEEDSSCTKHTLTAVSNTKLNVLISLIREGGQSDLIDGTAVLNDKSDEAKFTVNLNLGPRYFSQPTPYFVLEADNNEYACIWSCNQVDDYSHDDFSIILTRSPNPSEETLKKARKVYERNNIIREDVQVVNQNNC
ncbi:hypothetical protein WA026_003047 [Henosepilachna vigintioctopunctata]|uniref:Lipocalin/cytosolic fatty-acid binding domain-containing protein n=1 Tax=Henosepilachna vigintioctopunctata TaxID=420089 RepID=A0AAW1TNI0_9CUCU